MLRRLLPCVPMLAAIVVGGSAAQAAPSRDEVARLVEGDQCAGIAGYRAFRLALQRAAETRDVGALQRLFHPRGSMRVHGVHMSATAADADAGRFAPVWDALRDILRRGCARNGKGLVLPGIARLAEQNVPTETLVVIRPTWLHRRPSAARTVSLSTGRLLTELVHGDAWTRVQAGSRRGYVRTRDVRNPYDTRIEAAWSDGRWTIIAFGSGI